MKTPARRPTLAALLCLLPACAPVADGTGTPLTRAHLRAALGLPPPPRSPVTAHVEDHSRRRDLITERLLLRPEGAAAIPALASYSLRGRNQPLPGVLWMPGSPNNKEDLQHPPDLLSMWADQGFFVLSIDRPFHGQRPGDREEEIRQRGLPAVFGDYIRDLEHALQYLIQRPEVDAARLGMVGLSTGGMEALLLAALDDRLRAVVSVSGQLAWRQVFEAQAWQRIFRGLPLADSLIVAQAPPAAAYAAMTRRMPGLQVIDAARVAPMIAPRPLLLLGGDIDPLVPASSARATEAAARSAYEAAGAAGALRLSLEEDRGHAFSRQMAAQALAWCLRWL